MIAFLGSVFSPYYAWARRGGRPADPLRHVALNVALYGRPGGWAMTERGAASLDRGPAHLRLGPSALEWDGGALTITIRERTMPGARPVQGTVRVHPAALTGFAAALDPAGRHRWRPLAPRARVEVDLPRPGLRWSGTGYLDSNDGDEPLEAGFRRWDWCRAPLGDSRTAILYDTVPRHGEPHGIAIAIDPAGTVSAIAPPPPVTLGRTPWWRLPRRTRAEAASVQRTLVDAPFYARSVLRTALCGQDAEAMHESLDLDRFAAPWTQAMLPFRMPCRSDPVGTSRGSPSIKA